ncbi:hypothetical protein [Citrobacter pasteurii]|nr:hypothetical protein [Citrobacter pasteurii]
MQRIVGAGLVGDHIRAHAALHQFRHNVGGVRAQRNRDRFTLAGVLINTRQRIVKRCRLLVHVAGTQTEIDPALLAFNIQRTRTRQRCSERLRAAHAAQPGGQNPASAQVTLIMLTPGLNEGFISPLHDALTADVDPAPGGHLAVHRQPFGVQFIKVFPGSPMRHQVGVGNQHARRIVMGFEHADRFAGLNQQGFIGFKFGQRLDDGVIALPVPRCTANPAVNHQLMRIFRHIRIQIVH